VVEARNIAGRAVGFRHQPGREPTLVCVHGASDNHHAYDRILDALPERACYAIDLPGRAGTDGPPLKTVAEMEAFVSRFIESEVKGDYLLAGHSLGGGIALEHALASPSERLKGIVLLATGARLRVHPMILELFDRGEESNALPPVPAGLYAEGVDPEIVEEGSKARMLTPVKTGGIDWRAADAFDRMQDLKGVRVPALIVTGAQDALTPPKYAQYLAAQIPKSELHLLEGAGHMLVVERAPEVAALIATFASSGR